MKILYVIDSLKVGGAEVLLLSMIRDYKARGFDIALAYFSDGPLHEEFNTLGLSPYCISRHGLKNPLALMRLMRFIKAEKPDVVHTHLRKSDLAGQLCSSLMKVPVRISTAHNADPWRRNKLLTFIERICTAKCQKFIAVSNEVRDYLIDAAGYNPNAVVTIENGVDLDHFDPASVAALDKQALWGFEAETPVVGIIGRLDAQKDHDTFLAAARIVNEHFPSARFLLVGDGPKRQELEVLRGKLKLKDALVFTGIMRNMPEVLATLDIVVFSSRWEGLPVVLLEAMAMNRPLVATKVGGIPGLLSNNESGILVSPGEPEELAQGILRQLKDPAQAQKMATKCRPLIAEQFGVKTMHDRILSLYKSADNTDA